MALSAPSFPLSFFSPPFPSFRKIHFTVSFSLQIDPAKKKRKPKPSFSDQIRDKWSIKNPNLSKTLPWERKNQIQIVESEDEKEEEEGNGSSPFGVTQSIETNSVSFAKPKDTELNNSSVVNVQKKADFVGEFEGPGVIESIRRDSVSSVISRRVNLPPWVHGDMDKETQLGNWGDVNVEKEDNQTPIRFNKSLFKNETDESPTGFTKSPFKSEINVEKEPNFVGKSKGFFKIDETLIGNVKSPVESEIKVESVDSTGSEFDEFVEIKENPIGFDKSSVKSEINVEKEPIFVGKSKGYVKIDKTPIGNVKSPVESDKTSIRFDKSPFTSEIKVGNFDKNPIGFEKSPVKSIITVEKEPNFVAKSERFSKIDKTPIGNVETPVESEKVRMPWERERDSRREGNAEFAERLIPEAELRRLRNVAKRMVERIKVGSAGVNQELVDLIREKWRENEVIKLKFEGAPTLNMKRTHETLETRTGGLVIWRSGTTIALFRGMTYSFPCVQSYSKDHHTIGTRESSFSRSESYIKDLSENEIRDLNSLDCLLEDLGPRFKDWSGPKPLPIDGDLLPPIVRGFRRPFRLLPNGVKQGLRDKEMTFYRQSARTMPPHFAIGRIRELQGLAMAMVKLWERSAIAKLAIKRGVPNTNNERIAEELKRLTGGTLLSRNKDYIVFYRGNDFLPPNVAQTLDEAQNLVLLQQDKEEEARRQASITSFSNEKSFKIPKVAGTLAETLAATSQWENQPSFEEREKMRRDSALARHGSMVKYLENKLGIANGKMRKAEKALAKLQEFLSPAQLPTDLETLTDEERFLFRKIGLSMKPYLPIGRREMFDGTIVNIHLHWKYREVVKLIVERKSFAHVKQIAIGLEAESGGVLVSIDKTMKGHVIIIYRGKNYQRPKSMKPNNLLTKRQAWAKSIELQRREALKHHMSDLKERIEQVKAELEEMKGVDEIDEETFFSRIDDASSDEETDEEGDEDGLFDESANVEDDMY